MIDEHDNIASELSNKTPFVSGYNHWIISCKCRKENIIVTSKTVNLRKMTLGTGRPKIAVPITGKTASEIIDQAKTMRQRPRIWLNGELIFMKTWPMPNN